MSLPRFSFIVPTLNEEDQIAACLSALLPWRHRGHEVIVVDGGSQDKTLRKAHLFADQLLHSSPSRALQMNHGAAQAQGDVLLFLHADSRLPPKAYEWLPERWAETGQQHRWGRFDVTLHGHHPLLPMVAWCMNRRSRLSGIATGDQTMLIDRAFFEQVGGFPQQPLMEDIALSTLLRRKHRPWCLSARVRSSGRRWDEHGFWKTIGLMWWLRASYALGTPADQLVQHYHAGSPTNTD